jgi:hypothetical protein
VESLGACFIGVRGIIGQWIRVNGQRLVNWVCPIEWVSNPILFSLGFNAKHFKNSQLLLVKHLKKTTF